MKPNNKKSIKIDKKPSRQTDHLPNIWLLTTMQAKCCNINQMCIPFYTSDHTSLPYILQRQAGRCRQLSHVPARLRPPASRLLTSPRLTSHATSHRISEGIPVVRQTLGAFSEARDRVPPPNGRGTLWLSLKRCLFLETANAY